MRSGRLSSEYEDFINSLPEEEVLIYKQACLNLKGLCLDKAQADIYKYMSGGEVEFPLLGDFSHWSLAFSKSLAFVLSFYSSFMEDSEVIELKERLQSYINSVLSSFVYRKLEELNSDLVDVDSNK